MDFYTLAYVESQAVIGQTWGFIIIVAVLLALLILGVQVLRNGFTSRYRDLMVILSLIVVFFLGLEYQEYNRMKTYSEVNSLKIRNGMILKVSDAYYEVQFNPEFSTYTITRVYKVSPTDRIHDKEEAL